MSRTINLQTSLRIATPPSWSSDKKGAFLENIAEQVLRKQSYKITERIRFTGMEIDLLGTHKPSGDAVYIECKFHENAVGANVLDLMVGQSFRRKLSRLALFSASPLSKDAKGTLEELKADERVSFSFYGPKELLDAITDANLAPAIPRDVPANISHATLFIHPEHDYVWLFQEQQDGRPSRILVYTDGNVQNSELDDIRRLLDKNEVLEGLPLAIYQSRRRSGAAPDGPKGTPPAEVVSRVSTAENLIDYRPCRPSDFVGRVDLQKEIWDFLKHVRDQSTTTRIIALVGASGYGKSSLVTKLAERFRNKKWRSKYFLFPIDVRSARGPLFIAEALLAAIRAAGEAGFLVASDDLQVEDVDDVLAGKSITRLLQQLKSERKVLVIFFDQFEEAFTKDELFPVFRSFRRFALDVDARKENLVLGFSWRTGISLSDDNPAYQLWNELRDHRLTKSLGQFDAAESSRLISQFEELLGEKLLPPLRRQIHEQGQGLPWFLKKLCIHIYNQIRRGASQVDLVGSRLNVQTLFDEDLEPLSDPQLSCMRHIAAHSPVDSLEVYEHYGTEVVNELNERRLIVRAGQRFAVYWDIFRDYLTEGKVPYIPWTYIPNCALRMALPACHALAEYGALSTRDLARSLSYSERTAINIVTDLQNIAICGKTQDGKHGLLNGISLEAIPERLHAQFSEHIIYQRLLKVAGESGRLTTDQGIGVVRALYSSANVKPSTRDGYFSRLMVWFEFAGLVEIVSGGIRVIPPGRRGNGFGRKGARGRRHAVFLGAATPEATLELLGLLKERDMVDRDSVAARGWRNAAADLVALGLASWGKDQLVAAYEVGSTVHDASTLLVEALAGAEAMQVLDEVLEMQPSIGRVEIGLKIARALGRDWKQSSALRYANGLSRYREFLTKRSYSSMDTQVHDEPA